MPCTRTSRKIPGASLRFRRSCRPAAALVRCALVAVSAAVPPSCPAQSPFADRPEFFMDPVNREATLEKLLGGFGFTEGPAWDPIDKRFIFSDIPASRIYRYNPATNAAEVLREPSTHANGNFYDADGTLYTCEHEGRRVAIQKRGGHLETLVDRFEGKRFNSPNDLVVKRDGTVWFTDPEYGLAGRAKEQTANRVYRFNPRTGALSVAAEGFEQPNGLCFSPDEKLLYVADSGQPRNIRVFDVGAEGQLSRDRVFCTIDHGVPDGIRCDVRGNIWSTSEYGVQVFNPAGERLGGIPVPETPANLCFGGPDGDELYVTARTSVYHIKLLRGAMNADARLR